MRAQFYRVESSRWNPDSVEVYERLPSKHHEKPVWMKEDGGAKTFIWFWAKTGDSNRRREGLQEYVGWWISESIDSQESPRGLRGSRRSPSEVLLLRPWGPRTPSGDGVADAKHARRRERALPGRECAL